MAGEKGLADRMKGWERNKCHKGTGTG